MSLRPRPGLLALLLGLSMAAALPGCGGSVPTAGEPAKPIPTENPTANNPNVSIDEEYKHMDKLQKGNAPAK